MSVLNGQIANQTTFNNAFLSRTAATTSTVAKLNLQNGAIESGANVLGVQQAINETFDAVGMTGIGDTGRNDYASNEVVADGQDRKEAIEAIDAEFNSSTGHDHSTVGKGAPISANYVTDYNKFWAVFQEVAITAASSTSMDVSSYFTTKTSGGNAAVVGVITDAPTNVVHIVDPSTLTFVEDGEGQRVYGRITYSAGVWTLSFYTNEAGTETAHSLSSQNINAIFWEVFNQITRPTIPSNPFQFGTLDVTADVIDASASLRGVVSTNTQSFAGDKTFVGNLIATAKFVGAISSNGALTGSNAALAAPSVIVQRVTNASLVSIATVTSPTANQFFVLINDTGVPIIVVNSTGAGTSEILTGTGDDLEIPIDGSAWFVYDATETKWRIVGGSGSGAGSVKKYTFLYSDFSTAALTNTIAAFTLAAKEFIDSILIKHNTAFSGGAISAYTISVGLTGNADYYQSSFDVFQSTGDQVFAKTDLGMDVQSFASSTSVKITATSVGANLDAATAGSITIYVKKGKLPS